jgi:hypothetical protein
MANLTLAPEEDDPLFALGLNPGLSGRKPVDEPKLPAELQRLRVQFDPQKVGFGIIAPWPVTDHAVRPKERASSLDTTDRNDADCGRADRTGDPRKEQE